jgi:hypothetical protein
MELLSQLFDKNPLPLTKIEALNKFYNFGATKNAEILFK